MYHVVFVIDALMKMEAHFLTVQWSGAASKRFTNSVGDLGGKLLYGPFDWALVHKCGDFLIVESIPSRVGLIMLFNHRMID